MAEAEGEGGAGRGRGQAAAAAEIRRSGKARAIQVPHPRRGRPPGKKRILHLAQMYLF